MEEEKPPPPQQREEEEEVEDGFEAAASAEAPPESDSGEEAAACAAYGGEQWPSLRFDSPPRRIYHFRDQFAGDGAGGRNNFLKGVKWSPDGSCFLTSSDDNALRLFYLQDYHHGAVELAELSDFDLGGQDSYTSSLVVSEAEGVYDFCWYPFMCSSDPATCVFASTTKDHPIHLWDSISGQLRCTYRAYDAMDEITAALSVSFNPSGNKLFAGYNKSLRVFDVHRPGRDFEQHSLLKGSECPSGVASSIAFSPTHSGMLAVGTYSRTTALYAEDNMELLYVLQGQLGGLTQVLFSKDGNYLYTGGRKDPYVMCWDIRNTVSIVYQLYRSTENTNQRVSFDIEPCGRHLGTGGEDGLVHIYDLQSGQWVAGFRAASDTVNGFNFHPSLPLAASSSGHRRFSMPDNPEVEPKLQGDENCASIWCFS